MASSTLKADFRIHGLDCAEEVKLIRRQLDNTQGLHDLGFDVVRGRMSAEFDPRVLSSNQIIERISKTGLKAEPWQDSEQRPRTFLQNWGRWIATPTRRVSSAQRCAAAGRSANSVRCSSPTPKRPGAKRPGGML